MIGFRPPLVLVVVVAAILAAGCEMRAEDYGADGSFDRTLHVAGPAEVSVISRSGTIRIVAGASDQVRIAGRIRAYGSFSYGPEDQVEQLERMPPIVQTGNSISIGQIDDWMLFSNVSISYELTVPADTRVRSASRSGGQTIVSLRGPIEASSRSGSIRLEDVRGPLHLGSRSGDVTVEGRPAGAWDIETRSGDVAVRVPATAAFDVDVATRSGSIETARAVDAIGSFERKGFRARVRGGGPRIAVGTRSGSIRIE